jgi:hypothetical protein
LGRRFAKITHPNPLAGSSSIFYRGRSSASNAVLQPLPALGGKGTAPVVFFWNVEKK